MPIIEQISRSRINEKSVYLNAFSRNVTSQWGEDGIIEKVFDTIGINNKWCVEFGAWDGQTYSNTYNLVQNNGWHGVLIEGNRERFDELCKTYSGNSLATLVHKAVGFDSRSDTNSL